MGNRIYSTIDGVQTAYSYDANDRLTQQGGTTYTWDANGNTLTETLDGNTTSYSYNAKNNLIGLSRPDGSTTTYRYNINGIRNGKTEGGVTTSYIVDENRDYAQVLWESNGTKNITYTYGDDLISQTRNSNTSVYHYDGLGSVRGLSSATGSLTDTYHYDAFGQLLNSTGTTENSYLFTGEQFDQETNHIYLRNRYYNPATGTFIQFDTFQGIQSQPNSLHKYLYTPNDPVNLTDPSGEFFGGIGSISSLNIAGILATTAVATYQIGQVAATGGTWGDGVDIGPSSTGWLILAAMVGSNSSLLAKIAEKINEDDTLAYTLYHGTDIATARLLAGGAPIEVDGASCNWSASCNGFYLADQLGDAEHFAVFTQSGPRDGGVVQYDFKASAYLTIKGIATIRPIPSAPRFNPLGNEIIIPPSGFSIFNSLMLKGDIVPGPVR